jgi:hypothetical protein
MAGAGTVDAGATFETSRQHHEVRACACTSLSGQPAAKYDTTRQQRHNDKEAAGLDCLGCRLTGFAFGLGGGGYLMAQMLREPPPTGAHRAAVLVTAATMFAFGVYRALGG